MGVVGDEEGSSIEEESAGGFSAPDDGDGIGAVSVFWAWFADVLGAFLDVAEGATVRAFVRCDGKASAAFEGILLAGGIECDTDPLKIFSMRGGEEVEVEKLDVFTAGIVVTADEPGVARDVHSPRGEFFADLLAIGDECEKPCVWRAGSTAASATAVGRFVGVVEAGGAVTEDDDDTGMIRVKSGWSEHGGNAICLFCG